MQGQYDVNNKSREMSALFENLIRDIDNQVGENSSTPTLAANKP